MKTKVVVTGGKGQLAGCIKRLTKHQKSLEIICLSSDELDITNADSVNMFFENNNVEYCINCAAYTDVEAAEKHQDEAFQINANGVKYLAQACQRKNVILIHISTDYVFDGTKNTPYTPEDKTNPINIYGKSKLKGEVYIRDIMTRFFIVRTSWLYCDTGKNFYTSILEKLKTHSEIKVVNDQTGCPTSAYDLADFLFKLILEDNNNYGIYHFSGEEVMTWFGFAQKIARQNKLNTSIIPVESKHFKTTAQRPKYSVLSD